MIRKEALNVLMNVAPLLRDGTRFLRQEHEEQFHKAYEMAMDALRQPEIIQCRECKLFGKPRCAMAWDDYEWAEPDGYCHLAERREDE